MYIKRSEVVPYFSSLTTMVGVVSVDLISGFFECILYGVFVVLSTCSLALLVHRHQIAYGPLLKTGFRKWLSVAWNLHRSPLLLATGLLMITITAVSRMSFISLLSLQPSLMRDDLCPS